MSADMTEQNAAGGDDLRARYLPVSRKELRRRREAELAAQRAAQEAADATADRLAEGSGTQPAAAGEPDDGLTAVPEVEAEPEHELVRAVKDAQASEILDLPAPPQEPRVDEPVEETVLLEEDAEAIEMAAVGTAPDQPGREDTDFDHPALEYPELDEEIPVDAPEAALPEPLDTEEPARPEEEIADADNAEQDLADGTADEPAANQPEPEEFFDEQEAPIPASRRAQRLLRQTEDLPTLNTGLLQAVNQTTGEIAKHDDPNRVDPELLKKQQALAAKAMQANQERMRQQQADRERAELRRRHERPESEVITGKTLRNSHDEDQETTNFYTGQIEPMQAHGAHGLELTEMLDETSRMAGRQHVLLWLVAVLAALLLVGVALMIFL